MNLDKPVLLLVDVQNDFAHPEGALGRRGLDCLPAQDAVVALQRLLPVVRAASVPVLHVRTEHSSWSDTPAWLSRGDAAEHLRARDQPSVARGSWGAQPYLVHETDDELVFTKHRYSAFQYTALPLYLQALECRTLVLAGLTTDVCVRATAVDALSAGYAPVLVSDATATTGAVSQETACREFSAWVGRTTTVDALCDAWAPGIARSRAADRPA